MTKRITYKHITFPVSIFFVLIFSVSARAQETLIYSIGFTGNLSVNNIAIPTNSYPVIIADDKNCISLNNGLAKFLNSAKGNFSLSCNVEDPTQKFQFILFPNPTSTGYVTVKLTYPLNTTSNFLIKVIGMDGKINIIRTATLAQLQSGWRIPLPGLRPGVYVVSVSSEPGGFSGAQRLITIK